MLFFAIILLIAGSFLITILSFVLAGLSLLLKGDLNDFFGVWIVLWIVLFFIFILFI